MAEHPSSKTQFLAGINFPAVPHTLCRLLNLCLDIEAKPADFIQAIEQDSSLLSAFIRRTGATQLNRWHYSIDIDELKSLSLSLANYFSSVESTQQQQALQLEVWRTSVLRSRLSSGLAVKLNLDAKNYELLGLLAGLGNSIADISGRSGDQLTAEIFRTWQFDPYLCDAVQYQSVEIEELSDAGPAVQILAFSNRLLEHSGKEAFGEALSTAAKHIFDLETADLDELVRDAGKHLLAVEASFTDNGLSLLDNPLRAFQSLLADVNIQASLSHQLGAAESLEQKLTETARLLFPVSHSLLFRYTANESANRLICELASGEIISVNAESQKSQIAQCYQTQSFISAGGKSLVSIVDQQLCQRLDASEVFLMPLGQHGVIALGSLDTETQGSHKNLLRAYQATTTAAFENSEYNSDPMLNADQVRQQLSEITHEVNNPLSTVQNYLHMLSVKLAEDAAEQQDIKTISQEILRVSGIVQKYADIGKTSSDELVACNVNGIIEDLVRVFQGGNENIDFELSLDINMLETLLQLDKLKQVLMNLIKNAVEAHKHHVAVEPNIKVETYSGVNLGGTQYLEIHIDDNGPGIDAEIRERLFQPNNSSKAGHAGVGLSLVKTLLTEMNGFVSCRSRTEKEGNPGTHFQILIPSVKA